MYTPLIALAGLIASASAWITGDQTNISGNPFSKPGLGDMLAAGSKYTITWDPTTDRQGTITLLLCKGPPVNCVPQLAIVEGLKNTGKYEWNVPLTIQPTVEKAGYGIQLVVEANRQCQYTSQFGFTNPLWRSSSSSSSPSSSSSSSSSSTPSATAPATSPSNTMSMTTVTSTGSASAVLSTLTMPSGSTESPTGGSTNTSTSAGTGMSTSAAPTQSTTGNAAAPTVGVPVRGGMIAAVAGVGLGALLL